MTVKSLIALVIAFLFTAQGNPAHAQAGSYRLAGGPDVASEIVLRPDGSFQYFLIAGSLDEQAKGTWARTGQSLRLTTLPKPKPAVLSLKATARTSEAPLELHVVGLNGRGIAAVDFRIGFDSGDPVENYTQDYGWTLNPSDKRTPKWVEFEIAIYQFHSPRFPIDIAQGNVLTYLLTHNDIGTIDFAPIAIETEPTGLAVHRGNTVMHYETSEP